ncbi:MAG: hypothetical protein AAB551_04290 [Patescibacteria group bacterium]
MAFQSSARERLTEITDDILNPDASFVTGVEKLHSLFQCVSDPAVKRHEISRRVDGGGSAISPMQAAECLLDHARTKTFLRGIYRALHELQRRFPGERISVVYAGSGPFASLAIPLATQFRPDEIAFHVLDIHPFSLKNVRSLVEIFGLEEYFVDFINADATTWKPSFRPHLIFTETMDKGLCYEPQAHITANLGGEIRQNGLFLPESIHVEAIMTPSRVDFPVRVLGTAVQLTPASAQNMRFDIRKSFPIPDVELRESHDLLLRTRVGVFGKEQILEGEARITEWILLDTISRGGGVLELQYGLGGLIGDIRKRVEQEFFHSLLDRIDQ